MVLLVGLRVSRSATRFEVIAHPMYVLATPPAAAMARNADVQVSAANDGIERFGLLHDFTASKLRERGPGEQLIWRDTARRDGKTDYN